MCHTKKGDRVNRVKRYVAAENVSEASRSLIHTQGSLWRATRTFKEGLTPKEKELLERKMEELNKTQELMSKIAYRLRQSGSCV